MTEAPQRIGRYEIRRTLGTGAMGVVFEAWDPAHARRVALKTMRHAAPGANAGDGALLDRFRREAQTAGQLAHPNIVAAYEYGEDAESGRAFIAMEYVEGEELKRAFERNARFPLADVERIMTQLLAALEEAHAHGVVHRDVKPANVFMLPDGGVKIGDFGIARIDSSELTQVGSVLGTPSYMSPEQFMGQTVDGRSDLFAAGVILYQLLTGEKPFTGKLAAIMQQVLKDPPRPPSAHDPRLPAAFDALLAKALAKRPADRFQNARAFAAAVRAAVAAAPAEASTPFVQRDTADGARAATSPPASANGGVAARSATHPAAAPPAPPAPPASLAAPRRSAWPTVLVAGLVLALLLGIAAFYLRLRTPAPPAGDKLRTTAAAPDRHIPAPCPQNSPPESICRFPEAPGRA